jgi:signal transduction histidine kinase
MTAGSEQDARSRRPQSPARARRRRAQWSRDDDEALQVLKLGGSIGLIFLIIYTVFVLRGARAEAPEAGYYWLILSGTLLFFGVTWTNWFRRLWKFWTLGFCGFLMAMFVLISTFTQDPESRFIAIILIPLATASFVSWGPRWQAAMGALCVAIYAAADFLAPIESASNVYRWFGLAAAIAFAQCTAIFIERYRRRLRGQLDALEEAARFRETQMATMAHDIRSPVASLVGYAHLLEEDELSQGERSDLLARIGATAWNMNLVVTNVLHLYRAQEDGRFEPSPQPIDPRPLLAELADDCAIQARRKGLRMRTDLGELPRAELDPQHLDRIVRNLVAQAIARTDHGEVLLSVAARDGRITIEVRAPRASASAEELQRLFERPTGEGGKSGARGLGLYLARAMAEAAGGSVEAVCEPPRGLSFTAQLPLAPPREIQP